jgi:prepilin-type processing-associated H-X9-DG protein
MYEKKGCHTENGGNVLFADYHVEWVEPYSRVEKLVAKTKQRLALAS